MFHTAFPIVLKQSSVLSLAYVHNTQDELGVRIDFYLGSQASRVQGRDACRLGRLYSSATISSSGTCLAYAKKSRNGVRFLSTAAEPKEDFQ